MFGALDFSKHAEEAEMRNSQMGQLMFIVWDLRFVLRDLHFFLHSIWFANKIYNMENIVSH